MLRNEAHRYRAEIRQMRSEIEFRDAKIAAQEKELESLRHPDLRSHSGPHDGSHRQLNSHLREPRDAAASALTDARRRQQVLEQEAEVKLRFFVVRCMLAQCVACRLLHSAFCTLHGLRCIRHDAPSTPQCVLRMA
jgi:hypothetical protein